MKVMMFKKLYITWKKNKHKQVYAMIYSCEYDMLQAT